MCFRSSMNYERKYEDALERARKWYNNPNSSSIGKSYLYAVFPELTESEDEKIRKSLLEYLHTLPNHYAHGGVCAPEWIAWLEKQGEHVNFRNKIQIGDKVTRNEDGVLVNLSQLKRIAKKDKKQGEQKVIVNDFKAKDWYVSKVDGKIHNIYHSVDKVEPKFKVGDWITDGYVGGQITSIEDSYPCYKIVDFIGGINTSIPFTLQDNYHLWTIQDAKDGDVLAFKNDICGIIICKSPTNYDTRSYCRLASDNFINKEESGWDSTLLVPVTKEQRGLLFQKMKEKGYEWDAENKELKKIQQKFDSFCEEHCKGFQETGKCFADGYCNAKREAEQTPTNWSEEDEDILGDIIEDVMTLHRGKTLGVIRNKINWLKSLKQRIGE